MNRSILKSAVVATLGVGFVASPTVQATVLNYQFDAVVTKLAPLGSAFPIIKATDQYQYI